MERCSLLRTESLLIVVLTATVLSGCVSAPEPVDVESLQVVADVDPLRLLPEGPLRSALAPEPQPFLDAPSDVPGALRLWTGYESLPLPVPAPALPLHDALERFAAAHHTTLPAEHRLDDLRLDPVQEAALARVILSFLAAEDLQAQATAGLTAQELAFLAGDPAAIAAWSARTGDSDPLDYEAEAWRIVQGIDVVKNLQAADLLARAVEDLRGALQDSGPLTLPASNHLPQTVDGDADGMPDAVEQSAGWDEDDYGDAARPDEATTEGYGDDVILRIPRSTVTAGTLASTLASPLVILGPGDSTLDESPLLLIDLGGDDTYTGARFGGAVPDYYLNERAPAQVPLTLPSEPLVRLVVDVDGDDDYIPAPTGERYDDEDAGRQVHTRYGGALGGSVVGVSFLADLAGDDEYRSTVDLTAIAYEDEASATVYGAMQGGGSFGGVGALLDAGGSDTYTATVRAVAQEVGGGTPTASGFGVAQGGGYVGGLGALLDLGDGDDAFHLDMDVRTPAHFDGMKAGVRELAASQGAARTGAGILVDPLGAADLRAGAPLAQGAAVTTYLDNAGGVNSAASIGSFTRIPYVRTLPSVGMLFGSDGDGTYEGRSLSQGAALGAHGEGNQDGTGAWTVLYNQPNRGVSDLNAIDTYYAPAVGALIDAGGSDTYRTVGDGWLVQGSAALGSIALLADLEGDDTYDATGMEHAQGTGWLAQGVLVDQFGHDTYLAGTRSQGFATDDPQTLFDGRLCVGNFDRFGNTFFTHLYCGTEGALTFVPGPFKPDAENDKGTNQLVFQIRAQLPTLGVLVDRHGIDRYEAESESQGMAEGVLQNTAEAGACRTPRLYFKTLGLVDGLGAAFDRPFPPYLRACDAHFPRHGDPDGPEGEWVEPDTSAPPTHTFVLGLLVDTGGHDTYVYGGQKTAITPPQDGNNWQWEQAVVGDYSVGDSRMPQDNDRSRDHGFGTPEERVFVEGTEHEVVVPERSVNGQKVHDEVKVPVSTPDVDQTVPAQELPPEVGSMLDHPNLDAVDVDIPREAHQVYGRGVDENSVDAALQGLLSQLGATSGAVGVTLTLYEDEALEDELEVSEGEKAQGVVYAKVDVTLPDGVTAQRVKVLANGLHVGETDGSQPVVWDTVLQRDGALAYPDGMYRTQATVVLDAGRYGPLSVESAPMDVEVSNPPELVLLDLARDQPLDLVPKDQMSPAQGHTATLTFSITADLEFPTPELEQQHAGEQPGAYVDVSLVGTAGTFLVLSDYYTAGQHDVVIDGTCGGSRCDDDRYQVVVEAVDGDGNAADPASRSLLVDSTPPTSRIPLPTYAGADNFKHSAGTLRVPYEFDINPEGDPHQAGIGTVHVYRMPDGPDADDVRLVASGTSGFVSTGDNIRDGEPATFLAVAVDALGNSESPCLPGEAEGACVLDKLTRFRDGEFGDDPWRGAVTTTVDFADPAILQSSASHDFIAPGRTPVVFEAIIKEDETFLRSVTITFASLSGGDEETHAMTGVGGGVYRYAGFNGDRSADEELFIYRIQAIDAAGNDDVSAATGTLDEMSPRVTVLPTRYTAGGQERTAGGPQSLVTVRVEVLDATEASIGSVAADFSTVETAGEPLGVVDCQPDAVDLTKWGCGVILPTNVLDGEYEVDVTVTDLAQNVAEAVATVLVSNNAVTIGEPHVVATGPDSVTIAWNTDQEATSRVYYGRDPTRLDRSTEPDLTYKTQHEATLTDLAPSTLYFYKVASENRAGTETVLEEALDFRTAGAIALALTGLEDGDVVSGVTEVTVDVTVKTAGGPVSLGLFTERPDGQGGRQRIAEASSGTGTVTFPVDTEQLGDGGVRLVVQGARGTDVTEAKSPVLVVDNTEPAVVPVRPLPGLGVHADAPVLELLVFNAGGGAPLDASGIEVLLDGGAVTPPSVELGGAGVSRSLRIALPPLEEGDHTATVRVPDAAGNVGETSFAFKAGEDAGEDAGRVDHGAHTAVAPGGEVRFVFDSLTPLDAVHVDTAPLASGTIPLERGAFWSGSWTVPEGTSSGTYRLDVLFSDLQGEWDRIPDVLALTVDGDAPVVEADLAPVGPTSAALTVTADEPVTVEVLREGQTLHRNQTASDRHDISLKGLEGGTVLLLDVVVSDRAGNRVSLHRVELLPADTTPPGPVGDLQAAVEEGDVLLTWQPASDDGDMVAYRVERDDGAWEQRVPGPGLRDRDAPGGRDLTYTVTPLDTAGNAGSPRQVTVLVPERIEIVETLVTPEVGDTRTPFDIRVALRHNLGDAPTATLQVQGRVVTLTPLDDSEDCRTLCWYGAESTLPATRMGEDALRLHVTAPGTQAERALPSSAVAVVAVEDAESPAAWVLLPLLAALWVARRWRA